MTPRERALKEFSSQNISGRVLQHSASNSSITLHTPKANIDDSEFATIKKANGRTIFHPAIYRKHFFLKELSSSIFGEYQLTRPPSSNNANTKKDNSIRPSNAKWIDTSAQRKFVNFSKPLENFNSDSFVANRRANELKSSIFLNPESLIGQDAQVRSLW